MRRMGGFIAIALLPSVTAAYSQQPKSASYSCVDEFAGGLAYNYVTKRWVDTSFRVDGRARFILKVIYIGTHEDMVLSDIDVRFLRIYTSGYVDGKDNVDDAPSIVAGTCIEI